MTTTPEFRYTSTQSFITYIMTSPARITPNDLFTGVHPFFQRLFQNHLFHFRPKYQGPREGTEFDDLLGTKTPIHVVHPDKYRSTGLSHPMPSSLMSFKRNHDEFLSNQNKSFALDDPMLLYVTIPNIKMTRTWRTWYILMWVLLMFHIIVTVLIFSAIPYAGEDYGPFVDQNAMFFDVSSLVVMVLAAVLLSLAMVTEVNSLFFLFILLYGLDALVNILRAVSIPQLLHCLLQLALVEVVYQLRTCTLPSIVYTHR